MKSITKIYKDFKRSIYIVYSEPGDLTRYEYLVVMEGTTFSFKGLSGIIYPNQIHAHELNDITDISSMSDICIFKDANSTLYENVNPWTLKECIKTCKTIYDESTNSCLQS